MQALWMLAACACFGTMSLLIKLSAATASLQAIIFFRGAVPMLLIAAWAWQRGHSLKSPVAHLHLRRNVAGIAAMWLGFYATTQLPLATATTLMYTSPLFIAVFLWAFYKQRNYWLEKLAIALGFAGVLAVLQPTIGSNQAMVALLGLCAGGISAVAYLQLKSLGQAHEPEWRTVLYFAATATGSALAYGLLAKQSMGLPGLEHSSDVYGWLALLGLGLLGGAGNLALTRSFGQGSTWMSAALQYLTIGVSTAWGIAVFQDVPSPITWAGVLMIMLCGAMSSYSTHRRRNT